MQGDVEVVFVCTLDFIEVANAMYLKINMEA
jgi:hypothetical protein